MRTLITGDSIIGEILDINPSLEDILLAHGMHCLGCPASRGETLAEACEVHDINLDGLLQKLNKED